LNKNEFQMVLPTRLELFSDIDVDNGTFLEDVGDIYWSSKKNDTLWKFSIPNGDPLLIESETNIKDFAIAREAQLLFWPDVSFIMSSNLNGTNKRNITKSIGKSISIHKQNLYWSVNSDTGGNQSTVFTCLLNGSNVRPILTTFGIQTFIVGNDSIYFATPNAIASSPLKNNSQKIIIKGITFTNCIQIDWQRGKLYWNNWDWVNAVGSIWRSNLNGSVVEKAIDEIVSWEPPLFVISKNYIYFLQPGNIQRALLESITCPNNCSENGKCDYETGICQCDMLYSGVDCSILDSHPLAEILLWIFGIVMGLLIFSCVTYWGIVQCRGKSTQNLESKFLLDTNE